MERQGAHRRGALVDQRRPSQPSTLHPRPSSLHRPTPGGRSGSSRAACAGRRPGACTYYRGGRGRNARGFALRVGSGEWRVGRIELGARARGQGGGDEIRTCPRSEEVAPINLLAQILVVAGHVPVALQTPGDPLRAGRPLRVRVQPGVKGELRTQDARPRRRWLVGVHSQGRGSGVGGSRCKMPSRIAANRAS